MIKGKTKYILFSVACIILVGGLVVILQKPSEDIEDEIELTEYTVKKESIEVHTISTGVVSPQNRLEVKSPISGRIEKILVKEGDRVVKNQILALTSTDDRAALLDAASGKGPEERAKWEEIYPATPLMAPITGTIILKSFEEGQVFIWSDALFTISDRLTVKAQVDETDIAKIKKGQSALITLDAYKDEPLQAYVDRIAYDATTINNVTSYIVDVVPDRVPDYLRSGMTANVKFQLETKKAVLVVPSYAVKLKNGKSVVTVMVGYKKVDREIRLGITEGKKQEVLSGLSEGDIILVPLYINKNKLNKNSPSLVNL